VKGDAVGVIVGWGQSQRNHGHDIKPNELEIPIVNSSFCLSRFPSLAKLASVSSFCGGYDSEGKAPCRGDSGAGLYMNNSTTEQWTVRGIVSSSLLDKTRQCDINVFQVYTHVARFVDWIEEIIANTTEVVWEPVKFECSKQCKKELNEKKTETNRIFKREAIEKKAECRGGEKYECIHFHEKRWNKQQKFFTSILHPEKVKCRHQTRSI
jgi:secreted trypsin-like serine protease